MEEVEEEVTVAETMAAFEAVAGEVIMIEDTVREEVMIEVEVVAETGEIERTEHHSIVITGTLMET